MRSGSSSRRNLERSPSSNQIIKELSENVLDLEVMMRSIAEDSAEVLNKMRWLINSQLRLEGQQILAEVKVKPISATDAYVVATGNSSEMFQLFKTILHSRKVEIDREISRSKSRNELKHEKSKSRVNLQSNQDTILRAAVIVRDLSKAIENINRGVSGSKDSQLKYDSIRLGMLFNDLTASLAKYESQDNKFRGVLDQIAQKTQRFETESHERVAQLKGDEIQRLRTQLDMRKNLCDRVKEQNYLLKEYAKLKDAYIIHNNEEFKQQIQVLQKLIQKYNNVFISLRQQTDQLEQQIRKLAHDNNELKRINSILKRDLPTTNLPYSGVRPLNKNRASTPMRGANVFNKQQRSQSTFIPSEYSTHSVTHRVHH